MSLDIKVIPSLCTQVLDRDEKWVYVVEYARPKMSIRLERIFKSLLCNQFWHPFTKLTVYYSLKLQIVHYNCFQIQVIIKILN